MKTMETTEEVSSHEAENVRQDTTVNEALPLPVKTEGWTGKSPFKSVAGKEPRKIVHLDRWQETKWEIPIENGFDVVPNGASE
jgi:hypothetical protein